MKVLELWSGGLLSQFKNYFIAFFVILWFEKKEHNVSHAGIPLHLQTRKDL